MHDTACLVCPCPRWNGLSPNHLDLIEDQGMIMIWGLVPHIQPNQDLGHSPRPEPRPLLTASTAPTTSAPPQTQPAHPRFYITHCLDAVQDKKKTHLEHEEDLGPNPRSNTKSSDVRSRNEGNQGEEVVRRELEEEWKGTTKSSRCKSDL